MIRLHKVKGCPENDTVETRYTPSVQKEDAGPTDQSFVHPITLVPRSQMIDAPATFGHLAAMSITATPRPDLHGVLLMRTDDAACRGAAVSSVRLSAPPSSTHRD